jgi:hypothetical protein
MHNHNSFPTSHSESTKISHIDIFFGVRDAWLSHRLRLSAVGPGRESEFPAEESGEVVLVEEAAFGGDPFEREAGEPFVSGSDE